ncbi:Glycolate oxidase subunit glcD [Desulfamplus magnetovallimortis]|uniref:Glycolate oxidase subunit glcD n=1 Tax=Desulfamplus magnetovallimortis TaxID=1246637 RepID=A0A1W1HCW9_9BACT|nr:FAD-linked oxidase C-terminal domain-containing protein [Desulfamplus magnetovallimortis]SLM30273.1 Glycolate oxidase subunit glcD [Desulfamplus magnetovallimortis]
MQGVIDELQKIVGRENLLTRKEDMVTYSYDAAVLDSVVPSAAVMPETSEELGEIVKVCSRQRVPLTVRGSGTNLSGGTIPSSTSGVVLLTGKLNKILEINEADMYAVVQPGVVTATLAAAVEKKGLFYPPDPGSQAVSTIGGNVAENAGGLRGLKYGVTKDYVMGISFFDAMGEHVKSGSRTVKCATGYNLAGMMVGSEGTLGVMDEIILKLIPLPKARKSMVAVYKTIEKASETVAAIIANRIVPATLEILDNFTIRAVEAYSRAGLPVDAGALLLIEVDGHPGQVEDEGRDVEELCRKLGADSIKVASDDTEREKIWSARRSALSALAKLKPTLVLEDATVPRSQIPAMVRALQEIAVKYKIEIGTFGHAGDGNLHPTILTDKRNKEEWHRVESAIEEIFDKALALGGTLSGEHGTGLAKAPFLEKETGISSILFSRRLRKAMDPYGILNPGKVTGVI